jgi:hypothetical protein
MMAFLLPTSKTDDSMNVNCARKNPWQVPEISPALPKGLFSSLQKRSGGGGGGWRTWLGM